MMDEEWMKVLELIVDENINVLSQVLNHRGETYGYRFVVVQKDSRMGYLVIWKEDTLQAVNISRIKVPITYLNQRQPIPENLIFDW